MIRRRTARRQAIGSVLRKARLAAGLSQSELAARIGCSVDRISALEQGMTAVDTVEFVEIARALGTNPADLLQRVIRHHRRR